MTNELVYGDYDLLENETAFKQVDYVDEVLQAVKMFLQTKRGRFYPNKNYGSKIYSICDKPIEEYALAYSRQVVDAFDGVYVKSVEIAETDELDENNKIIKINLIINDEEGQVCLEI